MGTLTSKATTTSSSTNPLKNRCKEIECRKLLTIFFVESLCLIMKRSLLLILTAIAAIVFVTAVFLFQVFLSTPLVLRGSFFVSDAGRSHGGFEYNAEWNATLTVK